MGSEKPSPMILSWIMPDGEWLSVTGDYTFDMAYALLQERVNEAHGDDAPEIVWTFWGMYMTGDDADGKQWAQIEPPREDDE